MATIDITGVTKEFRLDRTRTVRALAEFNLSVSRGEFVALIGPSGCGKSTALHLLAALEKPSAGQILIDGLPPEVLGQRHELGIAFQDHALLPWRSVQSNLMLPFQIAGRTPDLDYIRQLIQLVGLVGFEEARPRQLSGGMRQRAAIARSLCLDPKLLLLDEPFGALDAVTRRHLNFELQRIWEQRRPTTLLVTHTVEEAVFLADRVVVMSGRPGTIVRELCVPFARPRSADTMREELFHQLTDELTSSLDRWEDK